MFVQAPMTLIVVSLDVVHVHILAQALAHVKPSYIHAKLGILPNGFAITLEMEVKHGVESHEELKEAYIGIS